MKANYVSSWFCIVSILVIAMPVMAQERQQSVMPEPWEEATVVPDATGADQAVTNAAAFFAIRELTTAVGRLEQKCGPATNSDTECAKKILELEKKTNNALNSRRFTKKQKAEIREIANEAILGADKGDLQSIRDAAKSLVEFDKRLIAVERKVDGLEVRVTALEGGKVAPAATDGTAPVGAILDSARSAVVAKAQSEQAIKTAEEAKQIAEEAKANAGAKPDDLAQLAAATGAAQGRAEVAERVAEEAKALAKQAFDAAQAADKSGGSDPKAITELNEKMVKLAALVDEANEKAKEAKKLASDAQEIARGKADTGIISIGPGVFIAKDIYAPKLDFEYTLRKERHRFGVGGGMGYYFGKEQVGADLRLFADTHFRYTYLIVEWFEAGAGAMSYWAGQPNSEHFGFGLFASAQFNIPTSKKFQVGIGLWGGPTFSWDKHSLAEPPGLPAGAMYPKYEFRRSFSGAGGLNATIRF